MQYIDIITETINEEQLVKTNPSTELTQTGTVNRSFIDANTISCSLAEIKKNHIIPVYIKDNETLISQTDFIETTIDVIKDIYYNEHILQPIVRVSHPMKGRIPEARNKPAIELLEYERTLYYERMAFIIEIPSIQGEVGGNPLSLTVGGVKSYNLDNLYSKKGSDEHFKVFIGFKNTVCTNMCVWSDGFIGDLKVSSLGQLKACILNLVERYNAGFQLYQMEQLTKYVLSENQFANLIGRCRMYQHLPFEQKKDIPSLLMSDTQINSICKDFYRDRNFCRDQNGNINLWRLYNLFTSANKSSYIDQFLDRNVNAFQLVEQIRYVLEEKRHCWYLN